MLTFRRVEIADVPTLRAMAERIWRVCYPPIIGIAQVEYMLGRMYSEEILGQEITNRVHWEIAAHEGETAGFLSITGEEDHRAKLNKLYLIPELHGKGFGQQLIAHACAVAAQLGARELWLQVNKRNERAILAYDRAGFRVAQSDVFDIGNGFVMDDYIMSRAIGI